MINHRPLLTQDSIAVIEESRNAKYVCTTELIEGNDTPVDVFYGDKEHPVSKSRYFGMYYDNIRDSWMICSAAGVENLNFALIADENGTHHYSRFRHDYFTTPCGRMIDGGRAYSRSSVHPLNNGMIVGGEMVILDGVEKV